MQSALTHGDALPRKKYSGYCTHSSRSKCMQELVPTDCSSLQPTGFLQPGCVPQSQQLQHLEASGSSGIKFSPLSPEVWALAASNRGKEQLWGASLSQTQVPASSGPPHQPFLTNHELTFHVCKILSLVQFQDSKKKKSTDICTGLDFTRSHILNK